MASLSHKIKLHFGGVGSAGILYKPVLKVQYQMTCLMPGLKSVIIVLFYYKWEPFLNIFFFFL